MRNTSAFIPNLLTPQQVVELQAVFEQVCAEFEIGPDDREHRDRIAESLMAAAAADQPLEAALEVAREVGRDIRWRAPPR